jgi:hypothetical protein
MGLLWKSDQPDAETATYKTRNKCKGRIYMQSEGFEPVITAIKRFQTCAFWVHGHRERLRQKVQEAKSV